MNKKIPSINDQGGPRRDRSFVLGHLLAIGIWSLVLATGGCDKPKAPAAPAGFTPRVASLVPGATDLIIGMHAAEHLVAVSNWETNRPEIAHLPRVGDYTSADWEKLAELKPDVMIVQMSSDRIPAGFQQRADQLKIRLVNVSVERLADIFKLIELLGELSSEPVKSAELARRLHVQLDAVAARVGDAQKVPTLLARDETGFPLIAGDTFIDDLLTLAGGKNVAGDFKTRYPTVDRERVMQLAPQAVIQLIPGASPQVVLEAQSNWDQMPDLPAVKAHRIFIMTDWYALQPGSHVGDLAEQFAQKLHPPP